MEEKTNKESSTHGDYSYRIRYIREIFHTIIIPQGTLYYSEPFSTFRKVSFLRLVKGL